MVKATFVLLLALLPVASLTPIRSPQALLEILGEDLEALLSGRDGDPALPPQEDSLSRLLGRQRPFLPGTPGLPSASPPDEAWLHVLRDLLNAQKKFRGRPKKMMTMGQQGCFGVKLDRIGTLSGLGC